MLIMIDDLEVLFPFDYIYPEQLQYMRALKSSLGKGHALLEMPTGTGKTITLLSLLLSYQYKYPEVGKIVYCTRTVHEMNKVLSELDNLQTFRETVIGQRQLQFAQSHPQLTQLAIELLNNIGIEAELQAEEERKLKNELIPTPAHPQRSRPPPGDQTTTTTAMVSSSMGIDDEPLLTAATTTPTTTTAARKNPFKRIYTTIVPSQDDPTAPSIQISTTAANQPIKTDELTVQLSSSSSLSKFTASTTTTATSQPTNIKLEPGSIGFDYNIIDDPNKLVKREESTLSTFNLYRMQQNSAQAKPSILTGPGIRSYIVQKTVESLVHHHGVDAGLAYEAVQILRKPTILGLSLSARTNMCIHPEVGQFQHREKVDTLCRAKTASSVREAQLKSILQRSQGGQFNPFGSTMTDEELRASLLRQTSAIIGMGMDDDSIPPPLDEPNTTATSMSTQMSMDSTSSTPPCDSATPCTNCPSSTSQQRQSSPNTSLPTSNTSHGHVVAADIEDILTSGLCPYYEGFLSHTNNRSTGYSNLHLAQSSQSTLTPYADSVRLQISASSSSTTPAAATAQTAFIPTQGVFDINSLINIGRDLTACPYYLARHLLAHSNIIVYNYHYMLDPKVNAVVDKDLEPESIIVFDEAHNIDNICIEALSITISKNDIYQASRALERLRELVHATEQDNQQKLIDEYSSILAQLDSSSSQLGAASRTAQQQRSQGRSPTSTELAELVSSPVIPQDMLNQAVPATIRRARGFLLFFKSLLEFLKEELVSLSEGGSSRSSTSSHPAHHSNVRDNYHIAQPRQLEPKAFLELYRQKLQLHDISSCKFVYDRLSMLLNTLNITDFDTYLSLIKISSFITLAANYEKGFVVLLEPFDDLGVSDPRVLLSCVDASIAIQPVFNKYSSVVITSGTLSPMTLYPTMLNFTPYQSQQFTMSLNRNVVLPLIISKGGDQQPISTSYSLRESDHIVNNYGSLVIQLSKSIPDGIIVFFPSYAYMENILLSWNQSKIDPKTGKHRDTVISQILKHKLIFVETKDIEETTLALTAYKRACDNGRGAVFFSIARGKVSEGIDFSGHYGRCVVMIGVPYQYTRSRTLLARLDYLRTELQISEAEYLNFDALRQTSQCLGRIIRSKKDYGLMVLADARYTRTDIRSKLPRWIQNFIKSGGLGTFSMGPGGSNDVAPVTGGGINTSLSIDAAIGQVKGFLLSMATPHDIRFDYGTVLLNQNQAHQHLEDLE